MNKNEFIKELSLLNINVTADILNKLDLYYKMLIEYNNHTNLTRITNEEDVYLKHFYDSLTLVKAVKLDNQELLDIGCGAGFPGMVLKILFPNLKVTLVDSLNKRIVFLNDVKDKLNLKNIKIYHARAEEFIKDNREKYDIVTSRAVANLNILSELCIPYVKENGLFLPLKADAKDEINNAQNAIKTLGGVISDTIVFELPKEKSIRMIPIIKKECKTNLKYPRKFSEIKKKSL